MLLQEQREITSQEMFCGLWVRQHPQRGVQHLLLQGGEPPSVQLLCLPPLSSTALLLGSVSTTLNWSSERWSFTLSSAGAHVWSAQLSVCPGGWCGCWAAGSQLVVLMLLTQDLLPCSPVPHKSAHPTPLATALGHLSLFCKANRSPGKGSSSCSASWGSRHLLLAHTHRLPLPNRQLFNKVCK